MRLPSIRLAPLVLIMLVCLVLAGLVALSFFDPKPPTRHFEVQVPNDRLAH